MLSERLASSPPKSFRKRPVLRAVRRPDPRPQAADFAAAAANGGASLPRRAVSVDEEPFTAEADALSDGAGPLPALLTAFSASISFRFLPR